MKKLKGKWALVTGSARGIGQQIAMGLAGEGCNVIVHGRKKENCTKTLELLKEYGVKTDVVEGELSSIEDIEKMIDDVKKSHSGVDILYNNAAIQNKWKDIYDITLDEWKETFMINFYSMVLICNAFAPGMKERGFGRIINLTSGIKDIPQLAPYSVSKAAVDKYSMDLAADLKGTGVLVNFLDPGWLKTDLGGQNAMHEATTVLPGALVPALLDNDGDTGKFFCAQDFRKD
jgi:NAD(P)-dependent dehydrogenase (short-subunit alcohol dehydrogenase family)